MSWDFNKDDAAKSSSVYANKDTRKFVSLLLESKFVVLHALIRSLDMGDEDKASDEVASVLITFLNEYGKVVPFLKTIIDKEVKECANPSTLFRGNSVSTKMLSRYTVEMGSEFLQAVVQELVKSAGPLSAADVELNPEKGKVGAQAAEKLTALCEDVVNTSLASLPFFPIELHDLAEHLFKAVTARFGDKMGLSAVGGFVFLRYVCPAMVAPERFSINTDLSKEARRILMAVSKVIQALANGISSFKEEYMRPMDAFLQNSGSLFNQLLAAFAGVPEGAPPPLPFDTLPGEPSAASRESLLAIHHHLKRNIHKIGSVVAALDSNDGLGSLKSGAEKSGWLLKRGGGVKSWKRRWFVLNNSLLMYFESPQAGSASGRIPLDGTRLEVVSEVEFVIVAEYRRYEIQAESEPEQKDWVRAIQNAIGRSPPASLSTSGSNTAEADAKDASKAQDAASGSDLRGWLKKAGPKGTGWKKRWFILNGNLLVYFKQPNDSTPQGEIKIDDARIRSVDSTRFNIEAASRTFYLQALSEKEKQTWTSRLDAARVEFVKQLVSEAKGGGGAGITSLEMSGEFNRSSLTSLTSPRSVASEDQLVNIESQAIIKEGVLYKQGGQIKTWKQRWFVLRGHQLYYYKSAADKEPLGSIPLGNSKITLTEKSSFEVLTGKRNFFLRATSPQEANIWIDALMQAAQAVSTVDKLAVVPDADEASAAQSQQVLCEGYLQKEGGKMKKWQMRWFVLKGPMLQYFKERTDPQAAGVIPVANCSVALAEDKIGKKNSFEISTRYRNYFLIAKDEYDLAKWMRHIEQAKMDSRKMSAADESDSMSENMKIFFMLSDILAEFEPKAE